MLTNQRYNPLLVKSKTTKNIKYNYDNGKLLSKYIYTDSTKTVKTHTITYTYNVDKLIYKDTLDLNTKTTTRVDYIYDGNILIDTIENTF